MKYEDSEFALDLFPSAGTSASSTFSSMASVFTSSLRQSDEKSSNRKKTESLIFLCIV